jgi:hypothetical protein
LRLSDFFKKNGFLPAATAAFSSDCTAQRDTACSRS